MRSFQNAPRRRRVVAIGVSVVAVFALVTPIAVNAVGAQAAAVVNCITSPTYDGLKSAKWRCDAVTTAKVRLRAQCWAFPFIPVAEKYGDWVKIPAGQWRYARFLSNRWCSSPGLIWSVTTQVR